MLLECFSVAGKPLAHLPDLNTVSSWGQVGERERERASFSLKAALLQEEA